MEICRSLRYDDKCIHVPHAHCTETLADYLVVAICPALIMLLVGSLMYFLVEVFYQGEFKARLLWVMAMFVMAIVVHRPDRDGGGTGVRVAVWRGAGRRRSRWR